MCVLRATVCVCVPGVYTKGGKLPRVICKKAKRAGERKHMTASRTLTLGAEKEIHNAGVDLLMQKSTHEY